MSENNPKYYLTGLDSSNGENGLYLRYVTPNFTSNALRSGGSANSQTDATFITVTPA